MTSDNENLEGLPQSLVDELKSADRQVSMITAQVDRELAEMAVAHFSNRQERAWGPRPVWAAIAATVLIALFVLPLRDRSVSEQNQIYADVDNSGRIDIADVLTVARTRDPEKITQAEIDAFAMQIVSLNQVGDAS